MSKTHCRFCKLNFVGLYLNCPKCGKWLAPTEGNDIAPDKSYEISKEQDFLRESAKTNHSEEIADIQQHSEDELKQIEKDLASSFEYWGSTQPQVFFGRTNAASMTAAQQFIERLCAYFDRQNREREQRLIKKAELKAKISMVEFFEQASNTKGFDWLNSFRDVYMLLNKKLESLQEPKK